MKKKISKSVGFVGYVDWELESFHGDEYSIKNGSSQNAYLIEEEKTVLVDTVWRPHRCDFVQNLKKEIDLNNIDFIVVNHSECDHSGALPALMKHIPNTPIYCSAVAKRFIEGQYGEHGWKFNVVKTGDRVEIGNGKELIFLDMKMLHWPDSMATYMTQDGILFSNDAFGQHFAVEELFADLADQEVLKKEALKYFVNILNPFAAILLKKLDELDSLNLPINVIAPSHGAVFRKNPKCIIDDYRKWACDYKENRVVVAYDTMWEGTKKIAHAIANEICKKSPETVVKVFNISKSDKNDVATEIFRSKAVAVGSPTVCNSILSSVAGFLEFLTQLKFKNKRAAAFGCYGWSGESVDMLKEKLKKAGFDVCQNVVKSFYNPDSETLECVPKIVDFLIG